jgi:hypothetical protein
VRHDEVFIHLTECLDSLNRSWRIIYDLEQVKLPPVLWSAAYGRALIEYSKPYKDSYGAKILLAQYRSGVPEQQLLAMPEGPMSPIPSEHGMS